MYVMLFKVYRHTKVQIHKQIQIYVYMYVLKAKHSNIQCMLTEWDNGYIHYTYVYRDIHAFSTIFHKQNNMKRTH